MTTSIFIHKRPTNEQKTMIYNNQLAASVGSMVEALKQNADIVKQTLQDSNNIIQENSMLRMTIANMKKQHEEIPRQFYTDCYGIGYCIEPNGTRKQIGLLSISSVQTFRVFKDGNYTDFVLVSYIDSKCINRTTLIPLDKLTKKNLIGFFSGFEILCKSNQLANAFLANMIYQKEKSKYYIIPEYAGFSVCTIHDGKETAFFFCNNENIIPELSKQLSPNLINKMLPLCNKNITEIENEIQFYCNTAEKCFLTTFSMCGILSSMLEDINCSLQQILVISSPNLNCTKQASMYLKLYNRNKTALSFDSNKTAVRNMFHSSKDETIVIQDCSIIDNENRCCEMVQYILNLNSDDLCQPHNTAIISHAAQYLIPANQKLCISLHDTFYSDFTQKKENHMCMALNDMARYFIDTICSAYCDIKAILKDYIKKIWKTKECHSLSSMPSKISYCVILSVYKIISRLFKLNVSLQDISNLLLKSLKEGEEKCGDYEDMIVNDFIRSLNHSIHTNQVHLIKHNKKMNFTPGTYQIICKDHLLMIEEKTLHDKILSIMVSTDNIQHTLKSLSDANLLHATKKNRYPLTVYNKGISQRYTFIAIESDGVLDYDIQLIVKELEFSEWFTNQPNHKTFIPVITNSIGHNAGQEFIYDKADNLHFLAIGQSNSGKTNHLTERMCSLQKKGTRIVIFDTSDSFSKESIIRNLSVEGNEMIHQQVEEYVQNHITFHAIENCGIPIDPLILPYPIDKESQKRIIISIITSHFGNMGKVHETIINQKIDKFMQSNDLSIINLYDYLVSSDGSKREDNLKSQFETLLSDFTEYECSETGWEEFLNHNKDITIISLNASSKYNGFPLIDILMMSLFYFQRLHPTKHLNIFMDEIQNQNFNANGPISQILREGRKYHTSLNYATQFISKISSDNTKVMQLAGLIAFFLPDNLSVPHVAKTLGISPKELLEMNQGECYIKGNLYNNESKRMQNSIIHGYTYRNFIPFSCKDANE